MNHPNLRIVPHPTKQGEWGVFGINRTADLRRSPVDGRLRLWVRDWELHTYQCVASYANLGEAKAKVFADATRLPPKPELAHLDAELGVAA
jgi:hypothetical protein